MKLLTPVIDACIVVAVVAWGGALLWWWRHGLHSCVDALVLGGLCLVLLLGAVCVFAK
jgi:hypothetical protein